MLSQFQATPPILEAAQKAVVQCTNLTFSSYCAIESHKSVGIMWDGSISREQLQQQISLLAILGGVQESVKHHQLTSPSNYPSSLTIDQESEIVSNLSFLASRRKDSKQVVAIAIETTEKSQEMVIRMAVNGEDAAYLKEGLANIGNILEKAARMDESASYYTDLLLKQVITSDFSRISTRLQMSKKYPLTTSRIMTLHRLLHESALNDTDGIDLLRATAQALQHCYSSLKGLPKLQVNSITCAMLEEVTKLAYRLTNADLDAALEKSSQANKTQLFRLKDSVAKLGNYYKACSQLVAAAMRKKCSVFGKIRVEDYQVTFPQTIKSSKPTSILPVLKSQIELLQQRPGIISTLLRRVAIMRPCIKLHAEIKLLFFYETHPETTRPRVIAANKSSCYLCDLFFSLHGQFQVPSTYGRLNERWILPDWIDGIPEQRVVVLRSIVQSISSILDKQVIAASKGPPHLPSPLQSLIGRSARWSASVLDLPSQLAQTQALRSAPSISIADIKSANFDFESALPDNEGKPYLSQTCGLMVPILQGEGSQLPVRYIFPLTLILPSPNGSTDGRPLSSGRPHVMGSLTGGRWIFKSQVARGSLEIDSSMHSDQEHIDALATAEVIRVDINEISPSLALVGDALIRLASMDTWFPSGASTGKEYLPRAGIVLTRPEEGKNLVSDLASNNALKLLSKTA
ncbi:hypothetical protein V497_00097 [Pseudogymnoascus sp. VKM F-4516 (FW-969)]|nr:hypothetical protein V497_00097 [Pseudogymnoascus sp. VKM F-4516 (FW-969)]